MSDIFELITDGDLDELKNLLQSNPSIANTKNRQGLIPLIFAIDFIEDPEIMTAIIKLLLEHGADPNQEDKETVSTPLIAAIENNNIEIIKLLLEHGANLENQDEKMFTPLNYAVEEGNMEIIKLLLEKGADPNEPDEQGCTSLFFAIKNDNPEIIKLLLEHGADLNKIILQQGFTTIAVAASQYATKPKAMDFLLEKLTDEQLREVLSNAITNDINPNIEVKLVLQLLKKDPKLKLLDAVLFDLGEEEDLFSPDLSRPKFLLLKAAVENGNLQLVRLLIKHGTDISSHQNYTELLTIAEKKEADRNTDDVTKIRQSLLEKTSAFLIMIEDGDARLMKTEIEGNGFVFYTTKNSEGDFVFCKIIDHEDPQRLKMLKTVIEANFDLWKKNIQGLVKYIEDKKDNDYDKIEEIVKELQNKNKEKSLEYLNGLIEASYPKTTASSPSSQKRTENIR